jgi:hypothetical protein
MIVSGALGVLQGAAYSGLHMDGVQISGSLHVITSLRRTLRNCKPL